MCQGCGHAMYADPTGKKMRDLTRAEAGELAKHEKFPRVRKIQEQIHKQNNHWG